MLVRFIQIHVTLLQEHTSNVQDAGTGAMLTGYYVLDKDQSSSADIAKTLYALWRCRYELDVQALKGALEREEAARAAEAAQHATALAGVQGNLERAEVGSCLQRVSQVPLQAAPSLCIVNAGHAAICPASKRCSQLLPV